ncbi:hypothetical protein O6H91_16G053800 [Diphasiastrum complanatum]|uniref:Uncharacterized protein n=1 Tax=Diphasiastrum complanatum TaxID=34168 RepID=A0ACC2BCE3_DIPCM|nr:hypothetical protein O6H91_16G053800 [Diphasiastrum complanatum]
MLSGAVQKLATMDSNTSKDDGFAVDPPSYRLLDFDWELRYAVSSNSLASVNKPFFRLKLSMSSNKHLADEIAGIRDETGEDIQVAVAEFSKTDLDMLIEELESIGRASDGNNNDRSDKLQTSLP